MSYHNKVYVSMDADNDLMYYRLMQAWKQNDNIGFNFFDAHDINNIYDKSEESIKAGLQERFRHSKAFVLLVGEHTKYLFKYVRWEIEQAIKRELPCIVVNINGKRSCDMNLCPALMRDHLAIHISFNARILQYALENWPESASRYLNNGEIGPFYYDDNVYKKLGL
ncbi:TIR domain-containing protein [Ruminococcus sp.]|uniref:TIR domain-containing protein n=1 Tax=Ruminococcus sp. TaxID=41978 RepID=UPI0025E45708|nr:TIR domain-containing protein [Ruminococcus sp.]